MPEEHVRECEACGASVYREHLDTGIAGYWEDQLLCAHCLQEKEKASGAFDGSSGGDDLETIALVDEEPEKEQKPSSTQVHGMSETKLGMGSFDESGLNRTLEPDNPCATRCRTFHAKLTDGATIYMNREINEWIDGNEHIRIKFATSTIGVYEGKRADPHLIVTLFY